MSIAAEKIAAEALALADDERAFLARELIVSLDAETHGDAEAEWAEVIDRRSREIAEGKVHCRPVDEVIRDIRSRLHASNRQPS
ncbi:MAG TPA: addiction module protein [Candidatus Aquilonibacter sp.]|nr:addiction module protein [Candidatus Aquilonibacter sp.]